MYLKRKNVKKNRQFYIGSYKMNEPVNEVEIILRSMKGTLDIAWLFKEDRHQVMHLEKQIDSTAPRDLGEYINEGIKSVFGNIQSVV